MSILNEIKIRQDERTKIIRRMTAYNQGVEDTIKEFLSGRRCIGCGIKKKQSPLSDMCAKCYEEQ